MERNDSSSTQECTWPTQAFNLERFVKRGGGFTHEQCSLHNQRYGESFQVTGRSHGASASPFRFNRTYASRGAQQSDDDANDDDDECFSPHPNFTAADGSRLSVLQKGLVTAVRWGCQAARLVRRSLPSTFTPDQVMAFLQDPDATRRSVMRVRIDLYANSARAITVPSTALDVFTFDKLPDAGSCQASYSRLSAFAADNQRLTAVRCQVDTQTGGVTSLHPVEQIVELGVRGAAFVVGVTEELSGRPLGSDAIRWSSAPDLAALDSSLYLQTPFCSFDVPALTETLCIRTQCHSASDCTDFAPTIDAVVSVSIDVATVALVLFAATLLAVRRVAQRSTLVQLILAAVFGVVVVLAGVSYLVLQFVTNTRFGKVGAWAMFTAGGVAAVLNGALSAVWHVLITQLAINEAARIAFGGVSLLSTLLCYRFLGSHLSGVIGVGMYAGAAALVCLAWLRNTELTAGLLIGMLCFDVAKRLLLWVRRLVPTPWNKDSTTKPAIVVKGHGFGVAPPLAGIPSATVGGAASSPRANVPSSYSSSSSWDDASPTRGDTGADGEAVFTGRRYNDVHLTELNDPEDDDAIRRKVARTAPRNFAVPDRHTAAAGSSAASAFVQAGRIHTQRALRDLAAHVRKNPQSYTDRVMAPDALLRFAGVDGVDSDSE